MYNSHSSTTFADFGAGKSLITSHEVKRLLDKDPNTIVISNCWFSFPHVRFDTPEELAKILVYIKYNHLHSTVSSIAPLEYLDTVGVTPTNNSVIPYVVYIDEVSLLFNSRDFAKNFKDKSLLEMIVQPRKYQMKLFFIVQAVDMIDKFLRELSLEIIEVRPYLFGLFRRSYSYDRQQFFSQESFDRSTLDVKSKKFFNFLPYIFFPLFRRLFYWLHLPFLGDFFYLKSLYFSEEILGSGSISYKKKRSIEKMILNRGGSIPTPQEAVLIANDFKSTKELCEELKIPNPFTESDSLPLKKYDESDFLDSSSR